eukprot:NODE_21343_length_758_cov_4.706815.p2 GENE.NODE_21343_length_758_cov_4.706815~~NODE_21343_length_758_cov_4.706815.p2  ORF type:complete len:106 (+),score=23.77 NODE_21343_length_758_cov_4.706815:3-320(+)
MELTMKQQLEAELARLARLREIDEAARQVERAVAHVIENILTLRCPSCSQAFVDFNGCFALVCARCGGHFCGWCLKPCLTADTTHNHVRRCRQRLSADPFFWFGE